MARKKSDVLPEPEFNYFTIPIPACAKKDPESRGFLIGLHQEMCSIEAEDGRKGSVVMGTGLGSDRIVIRWDGQECLIFGRDLLKAWVSRIDPAAGIRIKASAAGEKQQPPSEYEKATATLVRAAQAVCQARNGSNPAATKIAHEKAVDELAEALKGMFPPKAKKKGRT